MKLVCLVSNKEVKRNSIRRVVMDLVVAQVIIKMKKVNKRKVLVRGIRITIARVSKVEMIDDVID